MEKADVGGTSSRSWRLWHFGLRLWRRSFHTTRGAHRCTQVDHIAVGALLLKYFVWKLMMRARYSLLILKTQQTLQLRAGLAMCTSLRLPFTSCWYVRVLLDCFWYRYVLLCSIVLLELVLGKKKKTPTINIGQACTRSWNHKHRVASFTRHKYIRFLMAMIKINQIVKSVTLFWIIRIFIIRWRANAQL